MTNKQDRDRAIGMALQAISFPDNDEQRWQEMTEVDIYEEVLKGVPDDAQVSLTYQEGGEPIVYARRKKSQLVWSERMLLMKSAEPARKQHSDVTRVHMLLMPTDRISSVEVSYDVDTDDLLEVTNTESQGVSQPLTFEELDLDESQIYT